jgi:hypothetical protein
MPRDLRRWIGRYAGIVVGTRLRRPRSIAGLWTLGRNVSPIALVAFIVLKLAGLIAWSWWWVLSPIWINGIVLAGLLVTVLAPYLWRGRRLG